MARRMVQTTPKVKFSTGLKRLVKGQNVHVINNTLQARAMAKVWQKGLQRILNTMKDSSAAAIDYGLTPIWEQMLVYVPIGKTGELDRSLYLRTKDTPKGAIGEIGFGAGGHPRYAVIVHERTDLFHEPPTRAKFFQGAIEEHAHLVPARMEEFLELPK